MAASELSEIGFDSLFTIGYLCFCACVVVPPTEIASAGFTVQNLFAQWLGSEDMHFIYFHIRRSAATLMIHSLLPLGYYLAMMSFSPHLKLYFPWQVHLYWRLYLLQAVLIPLCMVLLCYYWSRDKWSNHPISKQLAHLSNDNSWRAVASSINVEFRRFDKFMSGVASRRVYVTDSWVLKTSTYTVYVAHQNDIHLTLAGSEEHDISYDGGMNIQYLNITVASINEHVKPFSIRLNSMEYNDLRLKLTTPVRNAQNIVIQQTLSDKFLDAFRSQIRSNSSIQLNENVEVEQCIGCMQKPADVTLQKQCDGEECQTCYCRPMWCLECMGKWFASRQDQQNPQTWLAGRSPCPTCRAVFCVLDVCLINS